MRNVAVIAGAVLVIASIAFWHSRAPSCASVRDVRLDQDRRWVTTTKGGEHVAQVPDWAADVRVDYCRDGSVVSWTGNPPEVTTSSLAVYR